MKKIKWAGYKNPRDLQIAALIHEFRGPLTALNALVQLFPEKKGDPRFMRSFQPMMLQQIDRLIGMMEGLADMRRARKRAADTIDLSELVSNSVRELEILFAAKNVRLKVKAVPGLYLRGDQEQLTSLVWNLAQNALESVAPRGRVWVSTSRVTRPGHSGPWLELNVRDDGPGIPKKWFKKIFGPYFSTKGPGNGLGLAICKRVVKQHRGHIKVSSSQKETLFQVRLPAARKG